MLAIQKYIKDHGLDKAVEAFSLKVYEDSGLLCLNYNQIDSPKCEEANECRGLILDAVTYEVISMSFYRFFNSGETQAVNINIKNAVLGNKEDGSLISFFYNPHTNKWQPATRGRPFADGEVPVQLTNEKFTFADLFWLAAEKQDANLVPDAAYNKDLVFIFELVSPYNRIVTPYDSPELVLLGARDRVTLEEYDLERVNLLAEIVNVRRPATYSFKSMSDIEKILSGFNPTEEGFVLVDYNNKRNGSFDRIKIKNPRYVALHHLVGAGDGFTGKRAVMLVQNGETEEVIAYFPEFEEKVRCLEKNINKLKFDIQESYDRISHIEDRKEFAEKAKETPFPWAMFSLLTGKSKSGGKVSVVCNSDELVLNLAPETLLEVLEKLYS